MRNRFSVGVTGGVGSGKSTVADLFAACGATIIDTDLIAHRLCAPDGAAIAAIRVQFGAAFIGADGAMDRAAMRDKVFSDRVAKQRLEAILHPLIRAETERAAQQAEGVYLMLVVPLLVESGNWDRRVARVLVIDCPEALQIQRVMQRNGLSEVQVRAIMAHQVSRATRLAAADDVIVNDADASALASQVDRLHGLYLSLAAQSS
ncbi:MAG: dephospho-CoA kinase [Glaciimonas sp.]|nr:dephospho-CoA kinase [Glaciimonas sp.]